MQLVTLVHGCEHDPSARYAVIPLDPAFARTALAAREALLRAKAAVPAVFRLSLLHARASWLTPRPTGTPPTAAEIPEDIEDVLQALLGADRYGELLDLSVVSLPEETPVPTRFAQDTEYDSIDVTEGGLRFRSYPRDSNAQQETDLIDWSWIERAAAEADASSQQP